MQLQHRSCLHLSDPWYGTSSKDCIASDPGFLPLIYFPASSVPKPILVAPSGVLNAPPSDCVSSRSDQGRSDGRTISKAGMTRVQQARTVLAGLFMTMSLHTGGCLARSLQQSSAGSAAAPSPATSPAYGTTLQSALSADPTLSGAFIQHAEFVLLFCWLCAHHRSVAGGKGFASRCSGKLALVWQAAPCDLVHTASFVHCQSAHTQPKQSAQ